MLIPENQEYYYARSRSSAPLVALARSRSNPQAGITQFSSASVRPRPPPMPHATSRSYEVRILIGIPSKTAEKSFVNAALPKTHIGLKGPMLSKTPVKIVSVVRRMRGASQSFLVQGSDGSLYVAKFTNNPQGNRSLINECIASHLLSALGVATPDLAVLQLTDSCLRRDELYFSTDRHEPVANGLHLGSRCPVDPNSVAIFDLLPRQLYSHVSNLAQVGTVFAFDWWVAHADRRQFLFARSRKGEHTSALKPASKASLTVWAIDNGRCFGGNWKLTEFVLPTWERSLEVYAHCNLEESALTGAKLVQDLPATVIQSSHQHVPRDWFSARDEEALAVMLGVLQQRQQRSSTAIHEQICVAKRKIRLAS